MGNSAPPWKLPASLGQERPTIGTCASSGSQIWTIISYVCFMPRPQASTFVRDPPGSSRLQNQPSDKRRPRLARELRIVRAEFRLNEFPELLGAEGIKRLAVDEEPRRLAHAQHLGVSQILLDDAVDVGIVHAGPDGANVQAGALKDRPDPVHDDLMVLCPLRLRRIQDVERLPELTLFLGRHEDLDHVRGAMVEGRVADYELDLAGVGSHELLNEIGEGRTGF